MNAQEREDAIESLGQSLYGIWSDLLSDGLNQPHSPEFLRKLIMDSAQSLGIGQEVRERALEIMEGKRASKSISRK